MLDKRSRKDINFYIKSMFSSNKVLCYYTGALLKNSESMLTNANLAIASKLDIGLLTYKYLHQYHHPDVFKDIKNYRKYLLLDKILRFENLRKELDEFFSKNLFKLDTKQLKCLYESPKVRESKHRHYTEDYYNKEVIDLIKHKDRIIFEEYNYEF